MNGFEAGTNAVQITPTRAELDELRSGFTDKPLFPEGTAQPLWAKSLAARSGGKILLVITADLLVTPLWMSDEVRAELSRRHGIPREAIAVCTSQNHSSPWSYPKETSYSRRLVQDLVKSGSGAVVNLKPARIGATKGYAPGIAYNSRLPITDETPADACPDRERHRGGCMFARKHHLGRMGGRPVDHEVGVIRIDDAKGNPKAVVYHYNCHPATVIEGPAIHGDFPGFASESIERSLPGVSALFLQGCLGNSHPRYFFTDITGARKNGRELADEVLRVLPDIRAAGKVDMDFSCEPFPVTFIPYPTDRLERLLGHFRTYLRELELDPARCWIGAGPDTVDLPPRYLVQARRNMVAPLITYCEDKLAERRKGGKEELPPLETEIQLFRLNDIALCMNAFEMFFQTGMEIKRLSPLRYTFPVGNANSLVGYVAPREEFELGGYQVVTNPMYGGLPGMRSPDNCDRIINRFMALLGQPRQEGTAPGRRRGG